MLINETSISRAFYKSHGHLYDLVCPNVHVDYWFECDLWCLAKSGYLNEIEIKTSVADFKKDAKKALCRTILTEHATEEEKNACHYTITDKISINRSKYDWMRSGLCVPNKFYYLIPEDMVEKVSLPTFSGLYTVSENLRIHKVKEAPFLHKTKITDRQISNTTRKFVYRYWNYRIKA